MVGDAGRGIGRVQMGGETLGEEGAELRVGPQLAQDEGVVGVGRLVGHGLAQGVVARAVGVQAEGVVHVEYHPAPAAVGGIGAPEADVVLRPVGVGGVDFGDLVVDELIEVHLGLEIGVDSGVGRVVAGEVVVELVPAGGITGHRRAIVVEHVEVRLFVQPIGVLDVILVHLLA